MNKLRLAIVGAGPAGIYAADIALKAERDFDISIDLFESLPAPYGLVRYGVAPDHPRIKGIIGALREVLDRGDSAYAQAAIGDDRQAEQVGVVIFALTERRELGARDGEFGAAQRLGGIAVSDFGKAGNRPALAVVLELFKRQRAIIEGAMQL